MKISTKKNLIIFHEPHEWSEVWEKIVKEYGAKIGISWVCKRELGFTIRMHKQLHDSSIKGDDGRVFKYYRDQVCLDFYTESMMSFFVLKYL